MTSHTASVCKTNFLTVFTLFLVAVLSSLPLHGQAASLTLTWEPNNENDLAGYRIYKRIPPSTNYGAPAFSGFPSNPVAPSQTIGGLTDETRYSFIATAIDVAGNESAPSNEVSGTTTGSTTPPPPPPPAPGPPPPPPPPGGSVVSINFQPASASTPTGFLKDDGAPFNASRGYGWSTRVNTRERNQSSNQSLDTLIHFDQGTNVTWQYTLPNGQYHISLASGDPTYHQGPHHVQVEGITVINNVSTQANKFVTVTNRLVTVSDGQLTIRLTRSGGSSKTLLNFVRIASTGSNPPPPAPGPPPPPPPAPGPPPPPPPAPGPPPPPPPPGGSVVSINFQPASASTPAGFLKDDGAPFNASRGYGWSTRVNTRERNRSSNQSLDTLIHFDQGTNVTWQYTLPNGQYHISLASGDPTYHQGPHHVQVEGITVINNVSTQANKFATVTNRLVTVSDGQLTIRLTRSGGSSKTLLNFVRIASTGSNPPPPAPGPPPPPPPSGGSVVSINFQPASASTPAGFLKDDGAPFNASRGYGWSTRVNTRERNRSSNQSLDTLIHFDQGTNVTWQYTLPNGQYHISLASGDPTYHQGPHHVQVEGITVINNVSTQANKFATVTNRLVTVSDGQLTIRLTRSGGSSKTLLNFVRIAPQ